jgi:hypothetical protein
MLHISWYSYRFTFSVWVLCLLILLHVFILCVFSISAEPLTSYHSLSVFYISWSSYKFSFSVCVLYFLILLQVLILCLCSIRELVRGSGNIEHRQRMRTCKGIRDPLASSHSLSVFYISWSSNKFLFSVCVLYFLMPLQVLILCLCSIFPEDIEHRQRMRTC